MGSLLGIAIRAKSRAPMEHCQAVSVTHEAGLDGDFRGRSKDRNVTVIAQEGWEAACAELRDAVPWTTRRANLLVEGVDLRNTDGHRLTIGEVVLEITEECRPCQRMDEAREGLRRTLESDWRAGVSCRVLAPGTIRLGDPVSLEGGG